MVRTCSYKTLWLFPKFNLKRMESTYLRYYYYFNFFSWEKRYTVTFQWTAQMLSSVPVLPRFNLVLSANFLSSYWENVLQTRLVRALIINNSWDFLWGLTRAFQKKLIFFSNENPSRQLKSAFYFILKAFFVPKIFKLFSWIFWSCRKTA